MDGTGIVGYKYDHFMTPEAVDVHLADGTSTAPGPQAYQGVRHGALPSRELVPDGHPLVEQAKSSADSRTGGLPVGLLAQEADIARQRAMDPAAFEVYSTLPDQPAPPGTRATADKQYISSSCRKRGG